MVFTDDAFLFGFLPLALLLFHGIRKALGGSAALCAMIGISAVFYAWWNPPYLALLAGSLTFNFAVARRLHDKPSSALLIGAVAVNLALLGYFKYRNFFLENAAALMGEQLTLGAIFIPLAISFYTFEQIALLVDVQDGKAGKPAFEDFATYVVLFPHLIAGPIVLFREMGPQFEKLRRGDFPDLSLFGPGLVVFLFGLFKKVAIADNLAPYVDTAFAAPSLTLLEAWAAAIGYGLQLYFDFSGYSDMAVGLALMLGFVLPINFDTPYRATSMIDFWKRWHITMTRFFTMYVYAPLAMFFSRYAMGRDWSGVRGFALMVAAPTIITFLLSGLWHGAGWTFVIFGLVNGLGLIVNHAWKQTKLPALPGWLGWALTMLVVIVSFVYFRSESLEQAHHLLAVMVSPQALVLPNWLSAQAAGMGLPWDTLALFSSGTFTLKMAGWMAVAGLLSVSLPNWSKTWPKLDPSVRLAGAAAAMLFLVGSWLGEPRSFIYFQF